MKKIILTGGGTGGHVLPALALVDDLRQAQYDVFYIGSKTGMEVGLVKDIPYYAISTGKLRRYLDKENIKDMARTLKGVGDAVKVIRKIKPDVIFSKGGFVSVPVAIASKICRVPLIIHESDITCGLANKIAIPFASVVCTGFNEAQVPSKKVVYTGSPIRRAILKGDAGKGKAFAGFKDDKPVLLIMGGSGGSEIINQTIRKSLNQLTEKFNVVHLCGKGNVDNNITQAGYLQKEFVSKELPDVFAMTDVVITRGGANALAELLALKKPSLIIPLSKKASRGDQIDNANNFKKNGYSMVLEEEKLNADTLCDSLAILYKNKAEFIAKMSDNKKTDSITEIINVIKNQTK